ncbi:MAG: hypothetical protein ABI467_05810 [Kofleriaceae bacterium]
MRAALVLLAACAAAVPELPGKGGPAWLELRSEHFTLWTDVEMGRATELARQLEYLHQVVYGVAFPGRDRSGRSLVIALRDSYEIHAYVPAQFSAFSWPDANPLLLPVIVFAGDTNERDGHVITHELTHVISHVAIHRQPVWFAEGIAQFFETVRLDPDKAVVDVGEPLATQVAQVRGLALVPGPRLFACTALTCRDGAFYMTSALVFAYLANTHPDQLLAYEDRLAAGDGPERAWVQSFPEVPIDAIDRTVHAWALQGSHRIWHFKVQLARTRFEQRFLSDAEVLAIRALLSDSFDPRGVRTQHAVAAALAADPTNMVARLVASDRANQVALADARAVARAHPQDWRAWWLELMAHATGDEAKIARARACTLAGRNAANMVPAKLCPSVHAVDVVPGGGEDGDQPVRPQQVP